MPFANAPRSHGRYSEIRPHKRPDSVGRDRKNKSAGLLQGKVAYSSSGEKQKQEADAVCQIKDQEGELMESIVKKIDHTLLRQDITQATSSGCAGRQGNTGFTAS